MPPGRFGYHLFDTSIGRCGVAWGDHGVAAVQLPESDDEQTVHRLIERHPGAAEGPPPAEVAAAIALIVALVDGERRDLSAVALDMSAVSPFHRRVYELTRTIPPGETLSYGEVAARLGSPGAARAVGQALGRNPFALVVPCHRVVAAGGKLGGFSAHGGLATKVDLLAREAAPPPPPAPVAGFDAEVAVKQLAAADPVMAELMAAVGPFALRLTDAPTTFAALARAIVYQQLHGRAAAAIYGRLCALAAESGGPLQPHDVQAASDEALLGAGLSRAKMLSLQDLARRVEEGFVPTLAEAQSMEDEAIIEELSQVRGIGRWSAEMFLIFTLGRPDVLPTGDFGIRKGFRVTYQNGEPLPKELPTPKQLLAFGERWRPYRSVASWYLWRALELDEPLAPTVRAPP